MRLRSTSATHYHCAMRALSDFCSEWFYSMMVLLEQSKYIYSFNKLLSLWYTWSLALCGAMHYRLEFSFTCAVSAPSQLIPAGGGAAVQGIWKVPPV
jgi:hypothetical protein